MLVRRRHGGSPAILPIAGYIGRHGSPNPPPDEGKRNDPGSGMATRRLGVIAHGYLANFSKR